MKIYSFLLLFMTIAFCSCTNTRIKEQKQWGDIFASYGLPLTDVCFEIRDNNHEAVNYFNLERCSMRFTPASTFKIFNSLVALETGVAPNDQFVIKWDSTPRRPEWDKDMNMREAFKVSCVPYYQAIARRIGPGRMQHYLDTIHYGNANMGGTIDQFWLNDSLKITADEQAGFIKKLYFAELPVSERSQRIVKSLMLAEQTPTYNLYYKTGMNMSGKKDIYWIVGIAERIEKVKEPKESMNKSDYRYYPYFFAQNFSVPANDTSKDWGNVRKEILHKILKEATIIND